MDVFSKAKRSQVMAAIRYRATAAQSAFLLQCFVVSEYRDGSCTVPISPAGPISTSLSARQWFLSMDASGMAAQNVFKHPGKTHPTGRRRSGAIGGVTGELRAPCVMKASR